MGTPGGSTIIEVERINPVTIEVYRDTLQVRGGGWLRVVVRKDWVHVGCHRISKEAWELLKKMVDDGKHYEERP